MKVVEADYTACLCGGVTYKEMGTKRERKEKVRPWHVEHIVEPAGPPFFMIANLKSNA